MTTLLFTFHHSGRPPCRHAVVHKLNAKDKRTGLGELGGTAPGDGMSHPNYLPILFDGVATGLGVAHEQQCFSRNLVAVKCDLFSHLDSLCPESSRP
jgi:hypothetical protein